MQFLSKTFFKGLAAVLPITVTLYVLWWLGTTAERILGGAIRWVLSWIPLEGDYYVPGLGVAAGVGLVLIIGVLTNVWITRALLRLGENLLERIPLVKTLYGSVRDLMGFFATDEGGQKAMKYPVALDVGNGMGRVMAFLTRDTDDKMPEGLAGEGEVAVYVPMSYQIGGFTLIVPRDSIEILDMSVENAMRFAVTAGVSTKKEAPVEALSKDRGEDERESSERAEEPELDPGEDEADRQEDKG